MRVDQPGAPSPGLGGRHERPRGRGEPPPLATPAHVTRVVPLQVNVAQFHPLSGNGVVYGTKKGRVRVFAKA